MWIKRTTFERLEADLRASIQRESGLQAEIATLQAENEALRHSDSARRLRTEGNLAIVQRMSAFGSSLTSAQGSLAEMAGILRDEKDKAVEAAHVSLASGQATDEIADSLLHLATESRNSAGEVDALAQRADEIGAIVKLIHDVADQTNLLALNAAIEAARAGEQGRGFAVVADEVRKLAERTSISTQEIASVVGSIQSGAAEAVRGMQSARNQVSDGVAKVEASGKAMADIEAGAAEVASIAAEMSDALREQASASNSIGKEVERISLLSDENDASAHNASQAADTLEQLSTKMSAAVGKFRIAV